MDPNSRDALARRRDAGTLTWRGPALMLFARTTLAVAAQGLAAAVFALRASPRPWHDAEPWLPVYGTLIDLGCLALLWRLTRREGICLFDLVGFERRRLARDFLLGLALIPVCLVFILAGVYAAGWLLYGTLTPPYFTGALPLPAALYGLLVWPFIWGLTEQMTYNGYLVPRFEVLTRSTGLAVAVVAVVWSLQQTSPSASARDRARPHGRRHGAARYDSAADEGLRAAFTYKCARLYRHSSSPGA